MESHLRMLATMVGTTSIIRTLERALRAMGSVQRLAAYLGVSPVQLGGRNERAVEPPLGANERVVKPAPTSQVK